MSRLSGKNKKAFADFVKKLETLGADIQQAEINVVNKTTEAAKAETIDNTPVGDYPTKVSFVAYQGTEKEKVVEFHVAKKLGGTLKGCWTDIPLIILNGKISKGYYNNLHYAPYVNNGHRVVNKKGETVNYLPGKRMLERGITRGRLAMRPLMDEEIRQLKRKTGF